MFKANQANAVIISMSHEELRQLIQKSIKDALIQKQNQPQGKTLTQVEAAKFLGITLPTIIKWKKDGKIPFHQIPGTRRITYLESELINCSNKR